MVKLDMEKCAGCGACAKVCPGLVLAMDGQRPAIVGDSCIACGHCVSVCPSGAVSLDDDLPLRARWHTPLEKNVMTRRSIRNYRPEAPERSVLADALRAAAWAPSAKNQRRHGWTVLYGRDKVRSVMDRAVAWCRENGRNRALVRLYETKKDLITCSAPCAILSWSDEDAGTPEIDCAIAVTTLELLLHDRGIGTCWGGFFVRMFSSAPELMEIAGVPAGKKLCCALMCGTADEDYRDIPARPGQPVLWEE